LIETNYAWGQQIDPKDERLMTGYESYAGTQSDVKAYVARPARQKGPLPGVLVIHENRGLNAHIEDVARRAALEGFVAVAPDGVSYNGGSPVDEGFVAVAPDGVSYNGGSPVDQEEARDHFRNSDIEIITADVIKGVGYLKSRDDCTGKVGTVGFCYGGGVSLQCAVANPAADACVLFYGRALSAEQVAQVNVPLMMNYAGNDPRVNAMIPDFRKALDENGVPYSIHMYPGTGHGFHNDTSQARYNEEAATLAWTRTSRFFKHYLAD
jgi:carboxymethylenebutenolidase